MRRSHLFLTLTVMLIVGIVLAYAPQSYRSDERGKCPYKNDSLALGWGFVAIKNTSETRRAPFVKFSADIYGKTNVTVENVTVSVPVVLLEACSYEGDPLWKVEFPGYLWAYSKGKYHRYNGTAVPEVLATNTSEYLYALVYQTAPRSYSEFRNYAPDDYFYVLGRNGTIRKFDLGKGFIPLRNAFLVSNGSYVLMGFERPQPDGSPMSGYVMILKGSEVVWSKTFQMNDPTCLCHVIPGWGKIDGNGCATFGLYDGNATYCDGKFTYVRDLGSES